VVIMLRHIRTQYRFSLQVGFGPRKALIRAVRTYVFGF
jgi:hypothetical protein